MHFVSNPFERAAGIDVMNRIIEELEAMSTYTILTPGLVDRPTADNYTSEATTPEDEFPLEAFHRFRWYEGGLQVLAEYTGYPELVWVWWDDLGNNCLELQRRFLCYVYIREYFRSHNWFFDETLFPLPRTSLRNVGQTRSKTKTSNRCSFPVGPPIREGAFRKAMLYLFVKYQQNWLYFPNSGFQGCLHYSRLLVLFGKLVFNLIVLFLQILWSFVCKWRRITIFFRTIFTDFKITRIQHKFYFYAQCVWPFQRHRSKTPGIRSRVERFTTNVFSTKHN